jgi:hypothetical protein
MDVYVSNITIPIGSDFEQTFVLEDDVGNPLNLDLYTGCSQLKKYPSSNSSASFTVTFPSTGKLKISLSSSGTSSIKPGRYYYDVIVSNFKGKKIRVVQGSAIATAGVTTS